MSWKGSGDFRGGSQPPRVTTSSGKGPGSIWDAGSAGGPSLLTLIIAACATGLVGLVLAVAFGGALSQTGQVASQPAAQPTARPAATAAATARPAATTAPAAGAATIPTEPLGPGLASGSGTALASGSDGESLAFDNVDLSVAAGLVTLTFTNNSSAVQHNWVLVDGGDDVAAAVNDAALAQSTAARNPSAAVPPGDTPGLVVATHQIAPGENVTFTFETPAAGTYTFLCTFPGHYQAGMVGQLTVE